jgi:predicted ferric reductase
MKPSTKRTVFYIAYLVLVFLPAVVMLLSPIPFRDWLRDLAVVLGYIGLALAGMQLVAVGRLHCMSDALDIDKVYYNHHRISLVAIFLIVAHLILLGIRNPAVLGFLNVAKAPWMFAAGTIALFGLLLIGISSVLRKMLNINYTAWLFWHDIFTVVILAFGIVHLFKVDYFTGYPLMKAVWWLLIAIWAVLILWIRVLNPLRIARKPYKVASLVKESANTYSLYLAPDGHAGVPFEAGQIAWLSLGNSPFVISRNPFSYSGSAESKEGLRFSIKVVGDFTNKVPALKPGDRVFVDGPYGAFNTHDLRAEKGFVLIAGGIGLAPVMSLLNTLADRSDKRPVYVFYGDLNEDTVRYRSELESLKSRLDMKLVIALEDPHDRSYLPCGYISKPVLSDNLPKNRAELMYFVCGPLPMLEAMQRHLKFVGVPMSQIKEEKYEMA